MATYLKKDKKGELLNGSPFSFGIAVAEWNPEVTESLLKGALETLKKAKVKKSNITVVKVPGSVELTKAAQWLANTMKYDAIIMLGCVVQGETRHFDYVCNSVTQGVTELNLQYDIPFIFGVLTTLNQQQALERAGGKYGNKGSECAETAIKMAWIRKNNQF
ncbi:MAG: 6,7-dimethyl-8-ribityllumazine synthase [Bacteroidales bacterium]|nr:6,7-dimethyl-8-ribityllumazine synthase [Bacteroidales bacterium]